MRKSFGGVFCSLVVGVGLFFVSLLGARVASAEEKATVWQGEIHGPAEAQRVALTMTRGAGGEWQAKGFYLEFVHDAFLIDSTLARGAELEIKANKGRGDFKGTISQSGDEIRGAWSYDGKSFPVELRRVEEKLAWQVPFLYQYHLPGVTYERPSADEAKRAYSAKAAAEYLEAGSTAWTKEWHCVACHTNGTYMVVRPMLTAGLGSPDGKMREYFVQALREQETPDVNDPKWEPAVSQVVYIAAGLAVWDREVTGKLSPETAEALELLFKLQRPAGDWYIDDPNNPPLESKEYQLVTVAARAVANAPGWRESATGRAHAGGIAKLELLLRTSQAQQGEYDKVDLLWTAAEYPGLVDEAEKQRLVAMIFAHQQADGGWSIRTFAKPEEWGRGNRAEKLRAEVELNAPPSDGHMTGLAIVALRKAGVAASDPRIGRGVAWLKANQRASGRWYTRSLNRDGWQFITYSGTAYPLLALEMCDALR